MSDVSDPRLPWLLEWGGTAGFVIVAAFVVRSVRRARALTPVALMLIGGWSIWWQEWWLDWAYYLVWSPEFKVTLGSDWTGWTTPVKPWMLVMSGYTYYWAEVFLLLFATVAWIRRRRPGWAPGVAFLVGAVPVGYGLNLLFEGFCTQMGWWTYTEAPSPYIHFGEGRFSLLTPIAFMTLFPVVMAWILQHRDDLGRFTYEARLGLRTGWQRVLAIVALMNVVYFATGILPGIVLRYATGPESTLVP